MATLDDIQTAYLVGSSNMFREEVFIPLAEGEGFNPQNFETNKVLDFIKAIKKFNNNPNSAPGKFKDPLITQIFALAYIEHFCHKNYKKDGLPFLTEVVNSMENNSEDLNELLKKEIILLLNQNYKNPDWMLCAEAAKGMLVTSYTAKHGTSDKNEKIAFSLVEKLIPSSEPAPGPNLSRSRKV